MTTTNMQRPGSNSDTQAAGQPVESLGAFKRRKRLDALEATRSHLAAMAAQQRSHALEEAEDSFNLQLVVEDAIREEFPLEYDELFPRWLEDDGSLEHEVGVLTGDCSICRSIPAATRINLEPPEAA